MVVGAQKGYGFEIFLDHNSSLNEINNIYFTSREIDIMACVLSGRANRRIASLLSIANKTVENHISNIISKIGGGFRENLIDFLEKSETFPVLKKHYGKISIKTVFEQKLKKISILTKGKEFACLIFYYTKHKNKPTFVLTLEECFKKVGITIYSTLWDPNRLTNISTINNIIYCISTEFLEQLKYTHYVLKSSTLSISNFLLLEQFDQSDIAYVEKFFSDCIDVTKQINGYFFIFEILKRLFPHDIIEKHIESFKKQYEIFFVPLPVKLIIINLPPRNSKFTGREKDLVKIQEKIHSQTIGVISQTISGLGGIGKTQLAIEFAYRVAEKQSYSVILWIPAETPQAIYKAYKKIAERLQIEIKNLNIDEIQQAIYKNLTIKYYGSKLLFILDNVTASNNIKKYLDLLHEQSIGNFIAHVLITSRSQDWSGLQLILDPFSSEESIVFIKKQLPNENEQSISNLSKRLHYFPLALSQAVAYIKLHTNIDDYLAEYTAKTKNYLDLLSSNCDQYTRSLWQTWNITLSKLTENGQQLLFVAAYLNADDIPIDFFSNFNVRVRMEAIKDLRNHSLIILIDNHKSFKIHRLLQEVIRLQENHNLNTRVNNHWLNCAINLLDKKFDFNFLCFTQWSSWEKYVDHAKIIAEHAIKKSGKIFDCGIKVYAKVAMFIMHIAAITDLKETTQTWLTLLELTKKHKDLQNSSLLVASINTYVGILRRFANNVAETKSCYEYSISIYTQTHTIITNQEKELINILRIIPLPHNVSPLCESVYNLIYTLIRLGNMFYDSLAQPRIAIKNYNKALRLCSQIENTDLITDPVKHQKIDLLKHVSRVYMQMGKLLLAEKAVKTAIELIDQTYKDYRQRALVYSELAKLYSYLGKFNEAEQLFQNVLYELSIIFSNKHFVINNVKIYKAYNIYMLGNIGLAKNLLEEAVFYLGNISNMYWHWFPKLLFARIYEFEGKYEQALVLTKESLLLAKKYYKEKLHDGIACQLPRAETWIKIKKDNVNIIFWQEMLDLTVQLFGPKHYQTARYHQLYGQVLTNIQQHEKAIWQYQRALVILKEEKVQHPCLVKFRQQNLQILLEHIDIRELRVISRD